MAARVQLIVAKDALTNGCLIRKLVCIVVVVVVVVVVVENEEEK